MKKIIKSFIFVLAFAMTFATAYAEVNFIPFPGYSGITRVSNYTDYPDTISWSSSTPADPGEVITVDIYVRNTGTTPAVAVVKMSPESLGASTSHTITGQITNGGALVMGSSSVSVSVTGGAQTLTYIEGTAKKKYTPAGCATLACVTTTSISGDALFGVGYSLGTITNDGSGNHIQAQYKVGSTPAPTYQCNDGIDNDGDGYTDFPSDGGCTSSTDTDEYNYTGGGVSSPSVSTDAATDEDEDSAVLNGDLLSTGGGTTTVYFKMDDNDCDSLDYTTSTSTMTSTGSFSKTVTGLDSDTEYCYRAYASNASGVDEGEKRYFDTGDDSDSDYDVTTDSATDIDENSATLRGEVEAGDYDVEECWFEWGTDNDEDDLDEEENVDCDVNDGDTEDFEETISGLDEDEKYYFRFCTEDTDGNEECGSIKDFTTDDDGGNDVDAKEKANIVTTIATYVTGSSAKLNGLMTESGDSYTYGYFEWGTTMSLTSRTADISLGETNSDIAFGNFVVSLKPNTLYYFRACGRNEAGVDCGDILSFRTLDGGGVTFVPSNPVTVTNVGSGGGNARIMLEIESPYENACPADINDYTVKYKNISGRTLEDVVLRVTLPEGVNFRRSSAGDFTQSDNTLTVQLDTLEKDEEGEVNLSGDVTMQAINEDEDIMVTTAVMAYTYSSDLGQEDAIAYYVHDTDVCRDGSVLGAFALFSGAGFFPGSLFGWLLLILIILAIIYVVRRISREDAKAQVASSARSTRSIDDLPY